MKLLPDQNHINIIKERLWQGRATVMIGSGFSRNAKKISPDVSEFPLWWELGAEIYKALNPDKDISTCIDPLSLATEYEANFGREALNQFLTQIIPDEQHSPDELHELLMSLPWSDIYTTNYDTLLERTRQKIYDKKYDVIYSPADIPGKEKPRIIKLHGSFPSHRPFIVTEEDYRTYPQKFAPFVNMVQQSIMENIFCLVGFSGTDPNFLNWIGWVRDNLGQSMPAIYLCGLLNLSDFQKGSLRKKGVITVDISPIFLREKWINQAERHEKGLEWFLLNLMYGEPVDISQWGKDAKMPKSKSVKWKPSLNLPSIPNDPNKNNFYHKPSPNYFYNLTIDQRIIELEKIYIFWKEERHNYPGWVICPEVNRNYLWRYTQNWVDEIFRLVKDIEYDDQVLVILYELNWRLEKCLIPLFEGQIEIIISVVKKFHSYFFHDEINIDQSPNQIKLTPEQKEKRAILNNKFNDDVLREAWINLASVLMKNAREDHKQQEFEYWKDILGKIISSDSELKENWYYQQCLFHLYRFEFDETKQVLNRWKPSTIFPFWVVKRASILAEIGNVENALQDTKKALIDIRTRNTSINKINYSLLSQESYAMIACEFYQKTEDFYFNQMQATGEITEQYRGRYKELAFYDCDPKQEFEKLSFYVNRPLSKLQPVEKEKRGFYPGTLSSIINISSANSIEELLPSFQFLKLYENVGLPIRIGFSTYYRESLIQASQKIACYAPLYAVGIMFRIGNNSNFSDWFDTVRIVAMPQNNIEYLRAILTKFINRIYQDTYFVKSVSFENQKLISSASLALLILTRISIQFKEELYIEHLIKFTINCYRSLCIINHHDLLQSIKELWKAIFYSITKSQLSKYLLELVQLPIANDVNYSVDETDRNQWPEPFFYFPDYDISSFFNIDSEEWYFAISKINQIIKNANESTLRSWAIFRLYQINSRSGLTEKLQSEFASALWSQTDKRTGLPHYSSYLPESAYLYCPEIKIGQAKRKLKEYLFQVDFPTISPDVYSGIDKRYLNNLISVTKSINSIGNTDNLINWSQDEAENLLDKIFTAVNQQKDAITKCYLMPFSKRDTQFFLELICDLLILVILPRIKKSEKYIKNKASNIIEILRNISESSVYAALPCMLLISCRLYDTDDVVKNLKQGLFSTYKNYIRQSLKGLYYWTAYAQENELSQPPKKLFEKLTDLICSLREPGLDDALHYTYLIVKKFSDSFQKKDFELLYEGLEYLLKETQYPKNWFDLDLKYSLSVISNIDKPTYREYSSKLAHQLYQLLTSKNNEIPDVLEKWKEQSLNDRMPQIRKIWEQ